jgi:hypothetical protein
MSSWLLWIEAAHFIGIGHDPQGLPRNSKIALNGCKAALTSLTGFAPKMVSLPV